MELKVGENYRLSKKIGAGSFGDIYMGKTNNKTDRFLQNISI